MQHKQEKVTAAATPTGKLEDETASRQKSKKGHQLCPIHQIHQSLRRKYCADCMHATPSTAPPDRCLWATCQCHTLCPPLLSSITATEMPMMPLLAADSMRASSAAPCRTAPSCGPARPLQHHKGFEQTHSGSDQQHVASCKDTACGLLRGRVWGAWSRITCTARCWLVVAA